MKTPPPNRVKSARPRPVMSIEAFSMSAGVNRWLEEDPAQEKARYNFLATSIARTVHGQWGEVDRHDARLNDESIREGSRTLSAYTYDGTKIWVFTYAVSDVGRQVEVIFPDEY